MKLESEQIEYRINEVEDNSKLQLLINKRIKEIISEGFSFYAISSHWPNENIIQVRFIYERVLERKVLTEKNKNISDLEREKEIHLNVSKHCSEKLSEERRQKQIQEMISKRLYSNDLFDGLLSGKIFSTHIQGIPSGQITLLMGGRK